MNLLRAWRRIFWRYPKKLGRIKAPIRAWLRLFPDDRLAALLAHAQDGKLAYNSCCCLVGALTADHPLQKSAQQCNHWDPANHLFRARQIPRALRAETAFNALGCGQEKRRFGRPQYGDDALRRRRLIPMIRAEMRRRDQIAARHGAAGCGHARYSDAVLGAARLSVIS